MPGIQFQILCRPHLVLSHIRHIDRLRTSGSHAQKSSAASCRGPCASRADFSHPTRQSVPAMLQCLWTPPTRAASLTPGLHRKQSGRPRPHFEIAAVSTSICTIFAFGANSFKSPVMRSLNLVPMENRTSHLLTAIFAAYFSMHTAVPHIERMPGQDRSFFP